jgi:hypothetical protein
LRRPGTPPPDMIRYQRGAFVACLSERCKLKLLP